MEEIKELTELNELEKRYEEARKKLDEHRKESDVEPLTDTELDDYLALTEEEKQEKYSEEQRASTDKLIEMNREMTELDAKINAQSIEAYDALENKIEETENKIAENDKEIASLEEEIAAINEQVALKEKKLSEMEDYDKDEFEELEKQIDDLKNEVSLKIQRKEEIVKENEKYRSELVELKNKKQQLIEEYTAVQYQSELNDLSQKRNELLKEEQEKYKEYQALKETEEYKNGDEKALDKANQLAKDVITLRDSRSEIAEKIKTIRKDINELTGRVAPKLSSEIDDVNVGTSVDVLDVDEVGEQETPEEIVSQSTEESEAAETPENVTTATERKQKQPKTRAGANNSRTVVGAPIRNDDDKVEEQDKEEKEFDPKEEFNDLCYKAKKGELADQEFNKLVQIMKDPESYEKFGITTGIIFNKSRGIFKALEKHIGNIDELSSKAKRRFTKELVGDARGKELLTKIASLDKAGLTKSQVEMLEKVQLTLGKQESFEQAKYVRDRIALNKNEKRWSWLIDFTEEKERLSAPKPEKTEKHRNSAIGDINKLVSSKEEQKAFDSTYTVPAQRAVQDKVQE